MTRPPASWKDWLPRRREMTEPQLRELDGIGGATAARIREYAESGKIAKLEELRAEFPPEFVELTRITGLGPKTALALRERLGVASVADLEEALAGERLRDLPGLGAKTEENLRNAVRRLGLSGKERRIPILEAQRLARRLAEAARAAPGVERAMVCGSLRRFRETVADLDILVAIAAGDSEGRRALEGALAAAAPVREAVAAGETKTTFITHSALQVDVRVVRPDQWGSAALHFTGSKEHNVRLRRLAIERGWALNEYALAESESGRVVASETEEEVYAALGLPWIPPELREDRGEIEAGQAGGLPEMVEEGDLRGDLHVHTDLFRRRGRFFGSNGCRGGRAGFGVRGDHRPRREPDHKRGESGANAGPAGAHPGVAGGLSPDADSARDGVEHRSRRVVGLRL